MKTDFTQSIADFFEKRHWKSSVMRLINAFVSVLVCRMFISRETIRNYDSVFSGSYLWYFIFVVEFYVFYELLNRQKADRWLMICLPLIYGAAVSATNGSNFGITIAFCIFSACAVAYAYHDRLRINIKKHTAVVCIAVLGVFFAVYTCACGILEYLNYNTSGSNLEIFNQMFYYMKNTGVPASTCDNNMYINHFYAHFSPILYLLLPFYFIVSSPITLIVAQNLIVVSGLIPLYLICRNHKLSDTAKVMFAAIYLLLPSTFGGCFNNWLEGCFLAPVILWLIYFLESEKKCVPAIIAMVLLMCINEEAAVYAIPLLLFFLIKGKNRKKVLIVSATFLVCLSAVVVIYEFLLNASDNSVGYYEMYTYSAVDEFISLFKNILISPIYTIGLIFGENITEFILILMLPVAFMPIMVRKPVNLILLMPLLVQTVFPYSHFGTQETLQTAYGSMAMMMYLVILNYTQMRKRRTARKLLIISLCCSVIITARLWGGTASIFKNYADSAEQREVLAQAEEVIPENASLEASPTLIANVSGRDEVYVIGEGSANAEYVYFDLRDSNNDFEAAKEYLDGRFSVKYYREHVAAVFRNNSYSVN